MTFWFLQAGKWYTQESGNYCGSSGKTGNYRKIGEKKNGEKYLRGKWGKKQLSNLKVP